VSRGRLIKNIANKLAHYSADGESVIDEAWIARRRSFDRWLGLAVHPSHVNGFLALFPTYDKDAEEIDDIGLSGLPSDRSIETLRVVMDMFFETMVVARSRHLDARPAFTADDENFAFLAHCGECFEKFLARCIAEIHLRPNADILEIMAYTHGFGIHPIGTPSEPSEVIHAQMKVVIEHLLHTAATKRSPKAS
jgi:hypothetical protein